MAESNCNKHHMAYRHVHVRTSQLWKAVVDVPSNLQRVVEDSTTHCRHQPIIPHLLQRVVECSQWHAFFSTTRCSVSGRGGLTICQSFLTDSRSTTRCRSLTLQRVVNKKACHWLHSIARCRRRGIIGWCLERVVESSTTRCRLHGTSTTAFHSWLPIRILCLYLYHTK